MILSSISDIVRIVTASAADIHVQSSWADITSTAFTPGRTNTLIVSAATTTVVGSPAASTQRQVKSLVIANRHAATSNTLSIQHYDGTNSVTVLALTLLAGESVEYDGTHWITYGATGQPTVVSAGNVGGSDTQLQFNDAGNFNGDAGLTWDKTSKTLGLLGADTEIQLKGITNEPPTPGAAILTVYSKAVCGKMELKQKGPSGLDSPFQLALWQNNTVLFTPGATAGLWQGTVGANLGTAAIALPTTTNLYTMMRRSTFASAVTTANQQVGTRSEAMFCRGNATGLGGFRFVAHFGFSSIKTGMRLFVGLCVDTAGIVTADPSSKLNMCGFAFDLADTAITFMHNDGTGTATKETIPGQGTLATNNTGYDAYIWCAPNDSTVYYRLDKIDTGNPVTLIDSSTNTKLPVNTTLLTAQVAMSNGTANIVANDATIGVNRVYVETDR